MDMSMNSPGVEPDFETLLFHVFNINKKKTIKWAIILHLSYSHPFRICSYSENYKCNNMCGITEKARTKQVVSGNSDQKHTINIQSEALINQHSLVWVPSRTVGLQLQSSLIMCLRIYLLTDKIAELNVLHYSSLITIQVVLTIYKS